MMQIIQAWRTKHTLDVFLLFLLLVLSSVPLIIEVSEGNSLHHHCKKAVKK